MIHVTIQQLSSYLDEQLAQGSADIVRQHVAECPECGARLGTLSRMDSALTRALSHDPGDALFKRLEREIASALGPDAREKASEILDAAPARVSAPSKPGPHGPPKRTLSAPNTRPSVAASSAAASGSGARTSAPAKAAPVVRDVPATAWTPSVTRATSRHVLEPRRAKRSSAGTWIAIFSLAVIAGSAGVVVSHTGTVQGWLDSLISNPKFTVSRPGASAGAESVATLPAPTDSASFDPMADFEIASGTTSGADMTEAGEGTTTSPVPPPPPPGRLPADEADDWETDEFAEEVSVPHTMRADEALATPDASAASGRARGGAQRSDPYAHLRPETQANVREAERLHQATLFHPTAEQFDIAALRWERALEGMSGPEQATVRGRLADARYRAWEAGPNPQRADAAIGAIRSYLLFAPPGTAREEAKSRLERLAPR